MILVIQVPPVMPALRVMEVILTVSLTLAQAMRSVAMDYPRLRLKVNIPTVCASAVLESQEIGAINALKDMTAGQFATMLVQAMQFHATGEPFRWNWMKIMFVIALVNVITLDRNANTVLLVLPTQHAKLKLVTVCLVTAIAMPTMLLETQQPELANVHVSRVLQGAIVNFALLATVSLQIALIHAKLKM